VTRFCGPVKPPSLVPSFGELGVAQKAI